MNEQVEINLQEICKVLIKRVWIIVLCAVILGAAVLAYTANFVTPKYTAKVTIYVNNNSNQSGSAISSTDLAVALRLVATYVNIVESDTVLEKVIEETGLLLTTNQVRNMLSASVVGETEMFEVKISSSSPQMSADLANAIADVAPSEIASIIEGSSAKVIDYAKVPTARSSPSYTTNAIIGALAGALLASLVIIIQNMMDVRIKTEEDLAKIADIPVLGMIPDMNELSKNAGKKVKR